MTRLRSIITAGVLILCFMNLSYGGTITGSRTGATGTRVGTITGSRVGTITGSRVGTITGSATEPSGTPGNYIYGEFLFRLLAVVLNGGW